MPGMSMYSFIPNEKFPNLSNFIFSKLFFLARNNLAKTFCAFSPLSVTFAAIGSLGLTFHVGILFMVLVFIGFEPVNTRSNFAALSSLSPDSPTPMFKVNFSILISFILFIFYEILFNYENVFFWDLNRFFFYPDFSMVILDFRNNSMASRVFS